MQRSTPPSRFRKSGLAVALGATAVVASAPLQTANASIIYRTFGQSVATGQTSNNVTGNFFHPNLLTYSNATGKDGASLYLTPYPNVTGEKVSFAAYAFANGKGGNINYTLPGTGENFAAKYGAGTTIGPSTPFTSTSKVYVDYYGQPAGYSTATDFYTGFSYLDSVGDPTLYGWLHFTIGAGDTPLTLVDYAYEDRALPIVTGDTGAVPEPASLSLIAIGAAGMLRRRPRRVDAATA